MQFDGNSLADGSPQDWEALIESVNPAALLVLIEARLSPQLRGRVMAEDIWQESLLHAWRSRGEFAWCGLKSFRSWLVSIIENRIRDAVDRASAQKRGGGRAPLSLEEVAGPRDGDAERPSPAGLIGSTTPSRIAIFKEQAVAMRAALEQVPEELRDVVRLRLIEQLSSEEAAQRLGVDASTVRRRFRRGALLYERLLRAELTSRSTSPASGERSEFGQNPLCGDRRADRS